MSLMRTCGLQSVDVQSGQCTYRKLDGTVQIFNTTQEIAAKLKKWLDGEDNRVIQLVVPELTTSQRELMLTGIGYEEWNKLFGDVEYGKDVEDDEKPF